MEDSSCLTATRSMSLAAAPAWEAPQFATVTFVSATDGSTTGTFRVPTSREMSVRRLAKEGMRRLVLSLRGGASADAPPNIAVTEVRVGGMGPAFPEIMAPDLLVQVVRVREEVVFMKVQHVRGAAPAAAPAAPAAATAADRIDASAATTRAPSPEPVCVEAAPPTSAAAAEPPAMFAERPVNVATAQPSEAKKPSSGSARPTERRRRQAAAPKPPSATASRRGAAEKAGEPAEAGRRPGWGPEAANFFPDNYCSSPDKLMRRRRAAARKAAAASSKPTEAPGKKGKKEDKAEETGEGEDSVERREGWGPEAYKNFASNYVASPDRLAREIRRRRREEAELARRADAAAPTRARKTARQLDYDEEEGRRATVGHRVESAVVVDDEESQTAAEEGAEQQPLPKGWGAEAAKYFDPETYCDDPRKAKVNIAARPRSVRPHRTPPSL